LKKRKHFLGPISIFTETMYMCLQGSLIICAKSGIFDLEIQVHSTHTQQ